MSIFKRCAHWWRKRKANCCECPGLSTSHSLFDTEFPRVHGRSIQLSSCPVPTQFSLSQVILAKGKPSRRHRTLITASIPPRHSSDLARCHPHPEPPALPTAPLSTLPAALEPFKTMPDTGPFMPGRPPGRRSHRAGFAATLRFRRRTRRHAAAQAKNRAPFDDSPGAQGMNVDRLRLLLRLGGLRGTAETGLKRGCTADGKTVQCALRAETQQPT